MAVPASPPYSVTRLLHHGITVSSLPRALTFWRDLLGGTVLYTNHLEMTSTFNPVGVLGASIDTAMLELPQQSGMIELLQYTAPAERAVFKPRACDVGSVHVALQVRGADQIVQRARAMEWRAASETAQEFTKKDGSRWKAVYLFGPDGETVELMEEVGDGDGDGEA